MDISRLIDGRIGDGLVKMGEMTVEEVDQVLRMQEDGDERLFGEIAVELDFIDLDSVIRYMERS